VTARAPATGAPVLSARGLTRSYDGFVALSPLDLDVAEGELIALIGPNGAGKTTFLTMVTGLLEPSGGELEIAGVAAGTLEARREVSYLPDQPVFYDDLSLDEHLEYVAALHGVADGPGRGRQLLDRLELEAWGPSLPSEFSRGMRQRASIALALVRPFSLLLADEPFDGLDPSGRSVLAELLAESRRQGAAVIVSTHRPDVVETADRCLALRDGTVFYDGPAGAEQIEGFFAE
jgi:ABC-2 type transport system ATP-binding protein